MHPDVNTPQEKPKQHTRGFTLHDVFGLGKVMDKLSFEKFTKTQTYCFGFALVLVIFCGGMLLWGKTIDGFPTAWDFRFILLAAVVLAFLGVFYKR